MTKDELMEHAHDEIPEDMEIPPMKRPRFGSQGEHVK